MDYSSYFEEVIDELIIQRGIDESRAISIVQKWGLEGYVEQAYEQGMEVVEFIQSME